MKSPRKNFRQFIGQLRRKAFRKLSGLGQLLRKGFGKFFRELLKNFLRELFREVSGNP